MTALIFPSDGYLPHEWGDVTNALDIKQQCFGINAHNSPLMAVLKVQKTCKAQSQNEIKSNK